MSNSKRAENFNDFADVVIDHIDNYTVIQYGDAPVDQVETWTPEQCMDSIKRYANRFGTNRRGRLETLRDMLKIAHYASLTFEKLKPTKTEIYELTNDEEDHYA
jgi:hypothetical protein